MDFNETWQEARSQLPLISLCFGLIRKMSVQASDCVKTKMAADWLRRVWPLLCKCNRWTEFNAPWQEARFRRHLISLCLSENQDGHTNLWLSETFSTKLLLLNGIQWNLKRDKYPVLNILRQVLWADHQHVFHSKKRYSGAGLWPFWALVYIYMKNRALRFSYFLARSVKGWIKKLRSQRASTNFSSLSFETGLLQGHQMHHSDLKSILNN